MLLYNWPWQNRLGLRTIWSEDEEGAGERGTDGTWVGLRETLLETPCFFSWRKFPLQFATKWNRRNNLETLWVNQQERDLSEKIQHNYVRQSTVAWFKLSTWQTRHIRQILINRLHTNVTFQESKTQTSTPPEPTRGHFPRSAYIHQWHVTVLRFGSKQFTTFLSPSLTSVSYAKATEPGSFQVNIWRFPKIGVSPNHPNFRRVFTYKPSRYWVPPIPWKPPGLGLSWFAWKFRGMPPKSNG